MLAAVADVYAAGTSALKRDSRVGLKGPLKSGFVGLGTGSGHAPDEIDDSRAERELCAVGILEPELAVADDPGAMQNPAGHPRARSQRPIDIDDGGGSVGIDIVDDQRGAGMASAASLHTPRNRR